MLGCLLGEYNGMHVFVNQDRAGVRPRFQGRAQVHHVAAVAKGGTVSRIEVGHSDEAVDRVRPLPR